MRGIVKSVMQRGARLARAIAGTDEKISNRTLSRRNLTSEEKRVARHMAHEGKEISEIAAVLKWELTLASLGRKLAALNIKPRRAYNLYLHRE